MPIELLNQDILIIIFALCAELEPPHSVYKSMGWIRLTHVNKPWRSLLLDQASLWGNIVCNLRSPEAYRVILHRARTAPLYLIVDYEWIEHCTIIEDFTDLLPRAWGITSFQLASSPAQVSLSGRTLPSTQELAALDCHDHDKQLIAPALRRLVILAVPFSIIAPNLHSLSIYISPDDPSTHHIPHILPSFPALAELIVHPRPTERLPRSTVDTSDSLRYANELAMHEFLAALELGSRKRTVMSYLTLISLSTGDALLSRAIWRSLVVPRTISLRVYLDLTSGATTAKMPAAGILREYLTCIEYDTLTIFHGIDGDSACSFSVGNELSTAEFCGVVCPMGLTEALNTAARYPTECIRTLHIDNDAVQVGDIREMVTDATSRNNFPMVQTLQFSGNKIVALSRILVLFAFPRLRTLELDIEDNKDDGDPIEEFARALRARKAFSKLERLVLRGWIPRRAQSKHEGEISHTDLKDVAVEVVDKRVIKPMSPQRDRLAALRAERARQEAEAALESSRQLDDRDPVA